MKLNGFRKFGIEGNENQKFKLNTEIRNFLRFQRRNSRFEVGTFFGLEMQRSSRGHKVKEINELFTNA